jgi:hypothetical protein
MKRRIAIGLAGLLTATVATFGLAPAAVANTKCSAGSIRINGNPNAEAPSYASGHSHLTGNHYVSNINGTTGLWTWRADNNGGSDGDTWDTAYGSISCK